MYIMVVGIIIMFILLMIFRINVTQGPLFGYVLYCQTLVIAEGQINTFYQLLLHELNSYGWVLQASLFLSSFWAMDFSLLGGNYCISESLNNMNVLLLNFRPIVILWKPFGRCFSKIRRNWSATDSIVHAYATLLFLTFSTLNHNVLQILKSTNIYNSPGKVYTNVLVNRPSIHVYSSVYIPYLIIVLILMFFLGVCLLPCYSSTP